MKIVFFGLSITSAWGNGHATTFRALIKALQERGHAITFFEKNRKWYEANRDLPQPPFCAVRLYDDWKAALSQIQGELRESDVAVLGSYFPDGIEAAGELLASSIPVKAFYDIDTPITVAQLREKGHTSYLKASQIPGFDLYFSFTGGPMLTEIETRFGAPRALPLYCSFDPGAHARTRPHSRWTCDMSYMGTYAPDRQPAIDRLLCDAARQLPEHKFIVAGSQYPKDIHWPGNVRRIVHLNPRWHGHFYSSSRFTLNVTRQEMILAGYSPSVRLFEAAGCAAAIVSDRWPGLDSFFEPGKEILLPASTEEVVNYIKHLGGEESRRIGEAARDRVLAEHTSRQRALEFERAVEDAASGKSAGKSNDLPLAASASSGNPALTR